VTGPERDELTRQAVAAARTLPPLTDEQATAAGQLLAQIAASWTQERAA